MACGTPVIGSNVGGIKYSVAHAITGYLVPPNDPDAIGRRLAQLYLHPRKLARMRKAAVRRANELFTWEHVAEQIGAVLERIARRPTVLPAAIPDSLGVPS
jgi:D-inositol-3-phosphate glycosyltransferase